METFSSKEKALKPEVQKDKKQILPLRDILSRFTLASAAFLSSTGLQAVSAQDPENKTQHVNVENGTPSQEDIRKLITALDDDRFIPRENASSEILKAALLWIREHQKHLPWKEWLKPQTDYSVEQNSRLRRIIEKCEEEERQLLWLPTRFRAPRSWNDSKNPPCVSDIIKELESQMGEVVRVNDVEELMQKKITLPLDGRTFWEVIDAIHNTYGDLFSYSSFGKGRINIAKEGKGHSFAQSNATCVDLYVPPYQPSTENTRMYMEFRSEQKIPLSFFEIREIAIASDTEEVVKISPWESTMIRNCNNYCAFKVSRPTKAKTIDLQITAKLIGYEPKVFHLENAEKRMEYETDACTVRLGPLEEYFSYPVVGNEYVKRSAGWRIGGRFAPPLSSFEQSEAMLSAVRIEAFDQHGERIANQGEVGEGITGEFQWWKNFGKKPASLTLTIPHKPISSFHTYFFPQIPLVRDDFHNNPIEAPPP